MSFPENGVGGFGSGMGWSLQDYPTKMSWNMTVPALPLTDHQQSLSLFVALSGDYVGGIETYSGVALHYFKKEWEAQACFFTFGGTDNRFGPTVFCKPGAVLGCAVTLNKAGTFAGGTSEQDWVYTAAVEEPTSGQDSILAIANVYQQAAPDVQFWVNGLLDWSPTGPGSVMACTDYPGAFEIRDISFQWNHSPQKVNWTPREAFNGNNCGRLQISRDSVLRISFGAMPPPPPPAPPLPPSGNVVISFGQHFITLAPGVYNLVAASTNPLRRK